MRYLIPYDDDGILNTEGTVPDAREPEDLDSNIAEAHAELSAFRVVKPEWLPADWHEHQPCPHCAALHTTPCEVAS